MSKIEILENKKEICINCAIRCETEWSRNFWYSVAEKLQKKIDDTKICEVLND